MLNDPFSFVASVRGRRRRAPPLLEEDASSFLPVDRAGVRRRREIERSWIAPGQQLPPMRTRIYLSADAIRAQWKSRAGEEEGEKKRGGYFRPVAVDCKPGESFATASRLGGIVDGNLTGTVPPCRFIGDVFSIISEQTDRSAVPKGFSSVRNSFRLALLDPNPGRNWAATGISLKINSPRCVLTSLHANSRIYAYERTNCNDVALAFKC